MYVLYIYTYISYIYMHSQAAIRMPSVYLTVHTVYIVYTQYAQSGGHPDGHLAL